MDLTERKITKIAREASKLAVRTLKEDGIGTAEYDFIHLVRHHPGIKPISGYCTTADWEPSSKQAHLIRHRRCFTCFPTPLKS